MIGHCLGRMESRITSEVYATLCVQAVVVTDGAGAQVASSVSVLQSECGVVDFRHTGAGEYYVYYLPHHQTGGGAGVHFSWFNCTDPTHGRTCVLDELTMPEGDRCAAIDPAASSIVVALENRPNSYGEHDHTPSGEPFHGFTKMELAAVPSELATVPQEMAVFMEPRENAIRMFDQVPAHWARNGGKDMASLTASALVGEYFVFQAGVVANGGASLTNMTASFGAGLTNTATGDVIPASAMTCFNLGGNDPHGVPFSKNYSIPPGQVGALWFGVDLAGVTGSGVKPGAYTATIRLGAAELGWTAFDALDGVGMGTHVSKQMSVTINVAMPSDGKPLPLHGDAGTGLGGAPCLPTRMFYIVLN